MPACLCWAANTCWSTLQTGKERLWRRCRIRQTSSLLKICKLKKEAKLDRDQHLIYVPFWSVLTAIAFNTIISISSFICEKETYPLLYLLQTMIHIKKMHCVKFHHRIGLTHVWYPMICNCWKHHQRSHWPEFTAYLITSVNCRGLLCNPAQGEMRFVPAQWCLVAEEHGQSGARSPLLLLQ